MVKKKWQYTWRRVRNSLKSKRDEDLFREKQQELHQLEVLAKEEYLTLAYYDETGFSLTSSIPYAWQEKGKTTEIPAAKGKRINVGGFLSADGKQLQAYQTEKAILSKDVVSFFDDFAKQVKRKTIVVLDNAPTHRSKEFMSKIPQWEEQDLYVYFLPSYSPELNKIEILWRKMKYEWMPFDAFESFENLKNRLSQLIQSVGQKYTIKFV